jgi:prephenate dehydratase
MTKRVAIQGIKGSFHHQVSVNYFSEPIDIIPLLSFSDVVKRLCSEMLKLELLHLKIQ